MECRGVVLLECGSLLFVLHGFSVSLGVVAPFSLPVSQASRIYTHQSLPPEYLSQLVRLLPGVL